MKGPDLEMHHIPGNTGDRIGREERQGPRREIEKFRVAVGGQADPTQKLYQLARCNVPFPAGSKPPPAIDHLGFSENRQAGSSALQIDEIVDGGEIKRPLESILWSMRTFCDPFQESLLPAEQGDNLAGIAVVYAANGDSEGLEFQLWTKPLKYRVAGPALFRDRESNLFRAGGIFTALFGKT